MHMHTGSDKKKMQMQTTPAVALTLVSVCYFSCVHGTSHKSFHHSFTSFTDQSRDLLSFSTNDSNIYKEALQITMDTSNPLYSLQNTSYGPFLGLFNNNTDGDPYNGVVGVESQHRVASSTPYVSPEKTHG